MLHIEFENYTSKITATSPRDNSELITCRHIGDKVHLYRPTQITERFPIVITPFYEVEGWYWFHLIHLSVCQSVDRIVSALYHQQYLLDPFLIYMSYQATLEDVSHVKFISKFQVLANSLNL